MLKEKFGSLLPIAGEENSYQANAVNEWRRKKGELRMTVWEYLNGQDG
tara:strand:- start:3029 stop:3172 length:144 start_codon:yes stop_codon:yes gene_type:complete